MRSYSQSDFNLFSNNLNYVLWEILLFTLCEFKGTNCCSRQGACVIVRANIFESKCIMLAQTYANFRVNIPCVWSYNWIAVHHQVSANFAFKKINFDRGEREKDTMLKLYYTFKLILLDAFIVYALTRNRFYWLNFYN